MTNGISNFYTISNLILDLFADIAEPLYENLNSLSANSFDLNEIELLSKFT